MAQGMTKAQQDFLTGPLSEFILREQGLAFAMQDWARRVLPSGECFIDGILRPGPSCGSVCCLGGSAQVLLSPNAHLLSEDEIAERLGLSFSEAVGLFYSWEEIDLNEDYRWPVDLITAFAKADNPLAKAQVAVEVLKRVAETKGACLYHPKEEACDSNQ